MSASDNNKNKNKNSLAGLTLDAVENRPNADLTAAQMNRTLIDIIKDEEKGSLFGHKDKKSWKAFRDRLRLKRAGAAWTSSIHIPTSDIPIQKNINSTSPNSKFLISRRNSVRFTTPSHDESNYTDESGDGSKHQMSHRGSIDESDGGFEPDAHAVSDLTPQQSSKQMTRHNSARMPSEVEGYGEDAPRRKPRVVFADERQLSAREAVADQEAADAEAAAKAQREEEDEDGDEEDDEDEEEDEDNGEGGGGPVKMSLMDLLEETDRQMGVVGSRYAIDDDEEVACEEEDEDDNGGGGIDHTCCVCMVKHKGAAFIPCGHTFCRLCSREQGVQRGNCPLCNGFILEMLDIF